MSDSSDGGGLAPQDECDVQAQVEALKRTLGDKYVSQMNRSRLGVGPLLARMARAVFPRAMPPRLAFVRARAPLSGGDALGTSGQALECSQYQLALLALCLADTHPPPTPPGANTRHKRNKILGHRDARLPEQRQRLGV